MPTFYTFYHPYLQACRSGAFIRYPGDKYFINTEAPLTDTSRIEDCFTPSKILTSNKAFSDWDDRGFFADTWSQFIQTLFAGQSTLIEFVAIESEENSFECEDLHDCTKGIEKTKVVFSDFPSNGFGTWAEKFLLPCMVTGLQLEVFHLHLSADGGFKVTLVLVKHPS